jgi:NitT/TauT family transport system permease protein
VTAASAGTLKPWVREHDRVLLALLSVGGVLGTWQLAATLGIVNTKFFGSPLGVVGAGIAEVQTSDFWRNVEVSGFEFGVGYVAAVAFGVPLGIILGWYRRLSYFFEPLLTFIYATPRIALLPVIVLWLGLTIWSKVAVVFLGAWVMILLTTYLGVRTVDPRYLSVARVFGARDREIFRSVVLPGSVPYVLAGLRLGVGRALIGVVVAELYAANAGLGFMISNASNQFQTDKVLFGTLLLIAIGYVAVEAIRRIEVRYLGWRTTTTLAA